MMAKQTIDLRIRVDTAATPLFTSLADDLSASWLGDVPLTLLVDGRVYAAEITRVSARDVEPSLTPNRDYDGLEDWERDLLGLDPESGPEPCEDYGRNGDSWPGYEDDI